MAPLSLRFLPRQWLELSARSARLRLTVMYSGMFLVLGTAVIVIIFLLVWTGAAIDQSASQASPVSAYPAPIFHSAVTQQHSADVARLLAVSWLALALTAGASALLGWFAAGRVLRPLRNMTATARTISAGNLYQRLALQGPEDEFKQLGDAFDALLARLETAFAAQRRFVTNAAHELRTPLTVERTLLQVALADPNASAASLRSTCEELLATEREQESLLEALLTLATSERGLERREPIDLARLAQLVVRAASAELVRRQLTVSSDLRPALLRGDPALVERLIANLLDNAIDYNHPGGQVEIRTTSGSGRTVLAVINTGPAIPSDEIERLFEPFQRLEPSRTGSEGHSGLGLSIVQAIATAHDATVRAEARDDGGLSVAVSFPAAAPGI